MKRTRKREELIRVGRALIVRKGFNATGLNDILTLAEVPKGSFYYYFDSKEAFGLAIIEDAAKRYQQKLEETLGNEQLSPLARLNSYFEQGITEMLESKHEEGCLFGNLAQEMSGQSPAFRDRLNKVFADWEAKITRCLEDAYANAEIEQRPTAELSEFILFGWQGALIRAKAARSTAPLQTFIKVLFETVLATPIPL